MAPASSSIEEQCPTLKLVVEKGPLSGQYLSFGPGSEVRIGRVVRGNTLSIKDAGISSKHLLIQQSGSIWTVTDLGSSNGTILNGTHIDPSQPSALTDGDVIKIGELTLMTVQLVEETKGNADDNEKEEKPVLRRNARRGARGKGKQLAAIDKHSELWLDEKLEDLTLGKEIGCEVKVRGARGSKAEGVLEGNEEKVEIATKLPSRTTRSSKKKQDLVDGADQNEEKVETRLGLKDGVSNAVKGRKGVSTRRTRSSRKEEDLVQVDIDMSVIEGKRSKVTRGRKKLSVCEEETVTREADLKHHVGEQGKGKSGEGGVDLSIIKEEVNLDREDNAEVGAEVGVTSSAVDLEKMVLGEWLDYLEVYLPKQINDATEEMILGMRQTVEKLNEFLQQRTNGNQG